MIVIDVTILLIVGTMAGYLWRNWSMFNHPRQVRYVRLIIVGMFVIAAFHLVDLIIMTVMPKIVGEQAAMMLMTDLAQNAPWLVTLIAVPLIFFGFIGSFRRQTELVRDVDLAREDLAANVSRVERILDLAAESILTLNLNGDAIGFNRAARKMFGEAEDDGAPAHIDDFLRARSEGNNGGSLLDEIEAAAEAADASSDGSSSDESGGVRVARGEGIGTSVDGREFPIVYSISGFPVRTEYLYTVVVTDVSATRRAETAMQMSQKMEALGRLAGGIAHDFNNLLAVILGSTELAASQLPKDSPVLEELEHVEHAGHRAANLTKQLMAFSRHKGMEPRAFDLGQMISDLEATLQRTVGERIRVVFHSGHGSNVVNADPSQMEQMLMNLVINARDSISGSGVITIKMESAYLDDSFAEEHPEVSPGYFTVLSVSDTGAGMDPELQKYIFEPFFTTKGDVGGPTGLGLSTAHGIIQRAGGTITVQSEPGKGSTFYIYLPISKEKPEVSDEAKLLAEVPGTETILLVEDRASVRRLVSTILSREGYDCIAADSGISALEVFRRDPERFDIVLSDVLMPGMGGIELARHVREIRSDIPILFMSGYADSKQLADKQVAGNIELMHKPFTRKEILGKIREALKTGT